MKYASIFQKKSANDVLCAVIGGNSAMLRVKILRRQTVPRAAADMSDCDICMAQRRDVCRRRDERNRFAFLANRCYICIEYVQ